MTYIPRLLITLFLIAAAVPLVTLRDGSAASEKPQAQSQAPGNGPDNKFRRAARPIRDHYVVVLKHDTRPDDVDFIANQLLVRHQGTAGSIYRNTIKGFSIQMPEAAAIALSRVPVPHVVYPGGLVTFNFTVSAPGVGKHNFQWRMVKEGVEWFGATTQLEEITVKLPPCARC